MTHGPEAVEDPDRVPRRSLKTAVTPTPRPRTMTTRTAVSTTFLTSGFSLRVWSMINLSYGVPLPPAPSIQPTPAGRFGPCKIRALRHHTRLERLVQGIPCGKLREIGTLAALAPARRQARDRPRRPPADELEIPAAVGFRGCRKRNSD